MQARLNCLGVLRERREWGLKYRKHVLATFQLARHNQQQRQALYVGSLKRKALLVPNRDWM